MDFHKNKYFSPKESGESTTETQTDKAPEQQGAEFTEAQALSIFNKVLQKYDHKLRDIAKNDLSKSEKDVKKFHEAVLKKLFPDQDVKNLSFEDVLKEKTASFDTTKEIKDLLSSMKADVLSGLSDDDQKIVDNVIASEAYALAQKGKILRKSDVKKTVDKANEFIKKTDTLSSLKNAQGDNQLLKTGSDLVRGFLGMSQNGASDEEVTNFMGMFNTQAMSGMKQFATENMNTEHFDYRNIGSSFQKMYSDSFRFQSVPGADLFKKVLLNKGNNAFSHILEGLKKVPDKAELSDQFDSLKRLYNTVKSQDSLSPSMKSALEAAGIKSENMNQLKLDLEEKMNQMQGVMNIIDGFKGFTNDQIDLLIKVLKEGSNREAIFNAFAVTYTILKFGVVAAATAVAGPPGAAIAAGGLGALHIALVGTGAIHDMVSTQDVAPEHQFSKDTTVNNAQTAPQETKPQAPENISDTKKYIETLGTEALDGIRDKYLHTTVTLPDGSTKSAYDVAFGNSGSKEGSTLLANKAFHHALIFNMMKALKPSLASEQGIYDKINKAAGGDGNLKADNFVETHLYDTLKTLSGGDIPNTLDRTALIQSMNDLINNAATKIYNTKEPGKQYATTADKNWKREITDTNVISLMNGEKTDDDTIDAFSADKKDTEHTTLLTSMEKQWQELNIEKSMNAQEKVLFGLLGTLSEPNWEKNYAVRDIQDAFIKNADAIFTLYTKLQKNSGKFSEYLTTYSKLKTQEDGIHLFEKTLSPERKAETDALKMLVDMNPVQMGQLKEAQSTYQGWEWFKIAMSYFGLAMDIVAIGNGIEAYKTLSKTAQNISKATDTVAKTQDLEKASKQIFTPDQRKHELMTLQNTLKIDGLAEDNAILKNLTDSDLIEIKGWTKQEWQLIKDMGYLRDGTKIGIQTSTLTHDTVLRMREWGGILTDPKKFQAFRLYLMHGSANWIYPDQRVALEGINVVKLSQDPAYFMKTIIEKPAFANAQDLFMQKEWERVYQYTGMDYIQMLMDVANKDVAQHQKLATHVFQEATKIVQEKGPEVAKNVVPSLAKIITSCALLNEAVNTTSFPNVFDNPTARLKDILNLEKRGEWIAKAVSDPSLREAFYHKYAPGKVKEDGTYRDTGTDQRGLINTILESDKVVLNEIIRASGDSSTLQKNLDAEFAKEKKAALKGAGTVQKNNLNSSETF